MFFFEKVKEFFKKRSEIDTKDLDLLEETLIMSDIGLETSEKLINIIKKRVLTEKYISLSNLYSLLKEEILYLINKKNKNNFLNFLDFTNSINFKKKPYVILVVGVNGVGKTTTVAKLAYKFKQYNKKVIIAAADTFRAGATEQILKWGKKINVEVIHKFNNNDPSSIVYDSIKKSINLNIDVVIIDTAGRLHNKLNLMNELSKIKRVIQKIIPEAPQEILLVLDGNVGQNAIVQINKFMQITKINSIAITKLDGTVKGGIIINIIDKFEISVKYIGTGENINNLDYFNPKIFVNSFFR